MHILCTISILLYLHGDPPRIKIGDHYHRRELQSLTSWMADRLELGPDTYIVIRFSKNPANPQGITLYKSSRTNTRTIHQFMIVIAADLHTSGQIRVLAHELVHVAQYRSGRLSEKNDRTAFWEGVPCSRRLPHDKRPWEIEAARIGGELLQEYLDAQAAPGIMETASLFSRRRFPVMHTFANAPIRSAGECQSIPE